MTFHHAPPMTPQMSRFTTPTTFKLGGVLGVVNLLIWGVIGGAWWKVIGLY